MEYNETVQGDVEKRCRRGTVSAYMTVEATLILSIVLMVYLFLIQSFLWIYDRCVLEQDMAVLALRCVNAKEDALERVWQLETGKLDPEGYLWLDIQEPLLQKQGWKLIVTGKGKAARPGDCGVRYEIWHFAPQEWLRAKEKWVREEETEKGEVGNK